MNNEKLMNAIGLLDDNVLRGTQIDAQTDVKISPMKKAKVIYFRIAAVAASLVLILLMAVLINNSMKAPLENNDEPLLAVVEDTLPPEDDVVVTTEEPKVTTEPIETKGPVKNNVENAERYESGEEVYNVQTPVPEVQITEKPVISYPDNNSDVSKEEKPLPDEEIKEELSTEIPEATEVPVITEEPEDDAWTETFVASNAEYSIGIGELDARRLVEQLFYSELGAGILGKNDNDWWYGVKIGETVYTQAELEVSENNIESYVGESLLKGMHRIELNSRETKAYIYKIRGVSENAAVAVHIDEQDGYYLFINPDFKAGTFTEFVEAYNLREFSELNAVAIYDQPDNIISDNIDSNAIWDILTAGGGYAVDYRSLYFDYEISGSIRMDVSMYGCVDVPIAIFDEGYVVIYMGEINGAYYVGADKITLIRARIAK